MSEALYADDKMIDIDNCETPDEINHPEQYCVGSITCIDVMKEVFGLEETLTFCRLNAFKYLFRSERKGGTKDLRKAKRYLEMYLDFLDESEKN